MTIVEMLRKEVRNLSEKELAEFRRWFAEYDFAKLPDDAYVKASSCVK